MQVFGEMEWELREKHGHKAVRFVECAVDWGNLFEIVPGGKNHRDDDI